MKTLERGFKAWAERTSLALRRELGTTVDGALCPFELSEYLGIGLWTPSQVPAITQDILTQLLENDPWGWSATSFQVNDKCIVIYNPTHSKGRQSSDVMHELAHYILDHQPATVILSVGLENVRMRSFDQKQEDEANCLAWALLLPREGLLRAKRRRKTVEQIAEQYSVTKTLVAYRINSSGIERQVRASRY
jgi:hypothetical protein